MNDLRVTKLKEYLFNIVQDIKSGSKEINVNRLSKDINNYSLDKIPTESVIETYITGNELHKDVYSFRSRVSYTYNPKDNIDNIGFFEKFERQISYNNKRDTLPNIDGIKSIECLNCGTQNDASDSTAEFDIQIQIIYEVNYESNISL